jgi:NTE family protein
MPTKRRVASKSKTAKSLNLALQGGGAHGAFTWGVIDYLLEDGRIEFAAVSATSAGSLNAVVLAQGLAQGGRAAAREALAAFWMAISEAARYNPLRTPAWAALFGDIPLEYSPFYWAFETVTRTLSPYQLNPANFNPLRDVLAETIDFAALRRAKGVQIYLCATNVETGKIRIFERSEMTVDAVLASACLPHVFQAVEIDGEYFWDGGYMGNPAIYPLIYGSPCPDVMIVHVNPIERKGLPRTAPDIANRINEISFNSSLMREMRAIAFVTRLIESGKVGSEEMKKVLIHSVRADSLMSECGVASKMDPEWGFLCRLRDAGRAEAQTWLKAHYADIGRRSTVDIDAEFL